MDNTLRKYGCLTHITSFVHYIAAEHDQPVRKNMIGCITNVIDALKNLGDAMVEYIETGENILNPQIRTNQTEWPGIPAIRHEQERESTTLLNILTSATFFSGVTATTLQISLGAPATSSVQAVNACWYSSLVLSIGAALNTVISMAWSQTRS